MQSTHIPQFGVDEFIVAVGCYFSMSGFLKCTLQKQDNPSQTSGCISASDVKNGCIRVSEIKNTCISTSEVKNACISASEVKTERKINSCIFCHRLFNVTGNKWEFALKYSHVDLSLQTKKDMSNNFQPQQH